MNLENRSEVSIKNTLAAQAILFHPSHGQGKAGVSRRDELNSGIGQKFFHPFQGFAHFQCWLKATDIRNDMEKFGHDQGRKYQLISKQYLCSDGCNRGIPIGMIRHGQLDKDITIQPGHDLAVHLVSQLGLRSIGNEDPNALERTKLEALTYHHKL